MKVQCPSCREIVEMAIFTTTEAGLSFDCPSCGKSNFIANPQAGPQASGTAAAAPYMGESQGDGQVVCPKCGNAQQDAYACHLCGLVFSKYDAAAQPPVPPEVSDLWERARISPDEEGLHEQFIKDCLAAGRPDYAARQYRILSRAPGSGELAHRMLARLQVMSQAQLAPSVLNKVNGDRRRRPGKIVVWIVLAVGIALLGYLLYSSAGLLDKMKH